MGASYSSTTSSIECHNGTMNKMGTVCTCPTAPPSDGSMCGAGTVLDATQGRHGMCVARAATSTSDTRSTEHLATHDSNTLTDVAAGATLTVPEMASLLKQPGGAAYYY